MASFQNTLRQEFYRILISVPIGLIALICYISMYKIFYSRFDNCTSNVLGKTLIETINIIQSNFWFFLIISFLIGEVITVLGHQLVLSFYERPIGGNIHEKYINIGEKKTVLIIKLLKHLDVQHSLLAAISEVYFALSKCFAGIFFIMTHMYSFFIFLTTYYFDKEKTHENNSFIALYFIFLSLLPYIIPLLFPILEKIDKLLSRQGRRNIFPILEKNDKLLSRLGRRDIFIIMCMFLLLSIAPLVLVILKISIKLLCVIIFFTILITILLLDKLIKQGKLGMPYIHLMFMCIFLFYLIVLIGSISCNFIFLEIKYKLILLSLFFLYLSILFYFISLVLLHNANEFLFIKYLDDKNDIDKNDILQ